MEYKTQNQIINEIETEKSRPLTAVEIIRDNQDSENCSIILNDRLFSWGYETEYTEELIENIRKVISDNDILFIKFTDSELPKAWADAYTKGGISEDRFDRRVIFHPYNEMNELFCVDQSLLWDITDEFKGTPHELTEEVCKWRFEIIKWYKNHLI